VAEGLPYVLGCVSDGVEVGIGRVDVREMNDDVESLQGSAKAALEALNKSFSR
jgi:hypothetical protein